MPASFPPDANFAVADDVAHFAVAAVECLAGLEPRAAARIERGALLGREEKAPELLGLGGCRGEGERKEEKRAVHFFPGSTMVMRSISQSPRSRGVMVVPLAACPVRCRPHFFTA